MNPLVDVGKFEHDAISRIEAGTVNAALPFLLPSSSLVVASCEFIQESVGVP